MSKNSRGPATPSTRYPETITFDLPNGTTLPKVGDLVRVEVSGKVSRFSQEKRTWEDGKIHTSVTVEYKPKDVELCGGQDIEDKEI